MQLPIPATIASTAFIVAFVHAAIPTHWLPFVLVARARGWSRARTLAVTAAAGLGHVALTTLLGLVVAWLGFQLDTHLGEIFPWVTSGLLAGIGVFYLWRHWRGKGVCHHHPPGGTHQPAPTCGHEENHSHWDDELKGSALTSARSSDWAAVSGLFVMLTLSPCEAFLGIYLSAVPYGWAGFAALSAILAVAALGGMTLLTWLTLLGLERFEVRRFERSEALLLGALFLTLAVLSLTLHHHHG